MVTKITGQDWSEINAEGLPIKFDDELLDEYWKVILWLQDNNYYSF